MESSTPKQNLNPFSARMRAEADQLVEQGHPEYLIGDIQSFAGLIVKQFTGVPNSVMNILEVHLHDMWHRTILAGKNINTFSDKQDTLVCQLIAVKNLGPIQPPPGSTDGNVCSDGRVLWSDLPLFGHDLMKEFTGCFFQKGTYTPGQQENLAGFLGRLLSVGIYDGPAICVLLLFRETLEVSRSLVLDPESEEVPLVDLMRALSRSIEQAKFSLALLASGHSVTTTANISGNSNISGLGELAIKAGNIPSLGYSRQRLEFWLQRLDEISRSGDKEVQIFSETCQDELLQLLRTVGETFGLGPGYWKE